MTSLEPFSSPVFTGSLVLKTRIAVLVRNLTDVQRALSEVKQRRADLRAIIHLAEGIGGSVSELQKSFETAKRGYEDGDDDQLGEGLRKLWGQLDELERLAKEVEADGPIGRLRQFTFLEDEIKRADDVARTVHESLEREIRGTFGEKLGELQVLLDAIDASTPGAPPERASQGMIDAWTTYSTKFHDSSERFFAEYVELVGGVAMRDTGFDRGVCRMAEELLGPVAKLGAYAWSNLTIPTRREALSVSAARIVRLGFPEWTIWTLPLTAHELGIDFVEADVHVAGFLETTGGARPDAAVCLADAFATYLMGPAYACPAILMRLDPAAGAEGEKLPAKRVATIIGVLRRMSTREREAEDMYGSLTARLALEWEAAVRQSGGEVAGEPGSLEAVTGLTDDELAEVNRWLEVFEGNVWTRRLDIEAWPKVMKWGVKLAAKEEIGIDELEEYSEVRYLLNAAWWARVATKPGEEDVIDPRRLREISDSVESLLLARIQFSGDQETPEKRQQRQKRKLKPPGPQAQPQAPPIAGTPSGLSARQ